MINYILNLIASILGPSGVVLTFDYSSLGIFFSYFKAALFFLPINAITSIVSILISITGFKIGVSMIKTILACIPII